MAKARQIKKRKQADLEGQVMAASSFGSKEFSRAYDNCAFIVVMAMIAIMKYQHQ